MNRLRQLTPYMVNTSMLEIGRKSDAPNLRLDAGAIEEQVQPGAIFYHIATYKRRRDSSDDSTFDDMICLVLQRDADDHYCWDYARDRLEDSECDVFVQGLDEDTLRYFLRSEESINNYFGESVHVFSVGSCFLTPIGTNKEAKVLLETGDD